MGEVYETGDWEASRNFKRYLDLPLPISYNPARAKVSTIENWQDWVELLGTWIERKGSR